MDYDYVLYTVLYFVIYVYFHFLIHRVEIIFRANISVFNNEGQENETVENGESTDPSG